ncbi:MAG: 5-formyltetrahydrofolate cyclo-ligase [Sphingobacteriales bacterium]|nr:5-formyltetrahydrofolate cyclo-ligase [Sphingobacteriales bacterium]
MNKAEARTHSLNVRKSLSEKQVEDANMAILAHFKTLDFSGIKYLHLFLPITAKNEVNTLLLADWLREHQPTVHLVLSKSDTKKHTLQHFIWDERTTLQTNQWGITEPDGGLEVKEKEVDMILIPLLAYDLRGNRVGYGKGFYDRFLAKCNANVQKVGLSYFEPIERIEDVESFDIKLNSCINPEKIWKF